MNDEVKTKIVSVFTSSFVVLTSSFFNTGGPAG